MYSAWNSNLVMENKSQDKALAFFQKYSFTLLNAALSPPENSIPLLTCIDKHENDETFSPNKASNFTSGHIFSNKWWPAFSGWSPREEISGMDPQSLTSGVGPSDAGTLMQLRITDFDSINCKFDHHKAGI